MPVDPTSRFSGLPLLQVQGPDGTPRHVVSLRIPRPDLGPPIGRHVVHEGEGVDLLARRLLGDEGLWWRLLDANPVIHPFDIAAGQILEIPGPGAATAVTRARTF